MKKYLYIIRIIAIFCIIFNISLKSDAEEFCSAKLNRLLVSESELFAYPISEVKILGSYVDVRKDGSVIFYGVSNGSPSIFFSYDINKAEVIDRKYLQSSDGANSADVCYAVDMGSDGIINIATQSDCMFFRYNPESKALKYYGKVFSETAVMAKGYSDSSGNYYFGTYPNARLIKYDKASDKLVDLGTMVSGNYIRSLGGYGNKLYMGGVGSPTAEFVKYDAVSGKKTVIGNPARAGVFTASQVENFYSISVAGKYLFAKCQITKLGFYMCVFDMELECWIDYIPGVSLMHCTDYENGLVYYHKYAYGTTAELYSYNPSKRASVKVEGLEIPNVLLASPKFVTLENQKKYPGRSIIAGANANGIIIINPETKSYECIRDSLPAQYNDIRVLKAGLYNELVISGYMSSEFVIYDTKKEKLKYKGAGDQYESIEVIGNKYYFGQYKSGAGLLEYDRTIPPSVNNPGLLASMNDSTQGRAVTIASTSDKIVWGSFPDYGKLGGAVAIYDRTENSLTGVYKPIANQSVTGLACIGDKIYGATSAYGGLGIAPADSPAHLFVMDYNGKVLNSVEISLTTDAKKQYFAGDMITDAEGFLWVACAQTLLKVDPYSLNIVKEVPVGKRVLGLFNTKFIPYCLEFGPDGLLYTNVGNRISAVDTETAEVKILKEVVAGSLTICNDGHLYYTNEASAEYISRIQITRLKGSGTSADPYVISDGETFAKVFGNKNILSTHLFSNCFVQDSDIVLPSDYHPNSAWFQGSYAGDTKYRVIDFGERTDAATNFALFYSIGADGVVSNIHTKGTIGNKDTSYYSSIAVYNYGTVSRCKSSVDLYGKLGVGGLVMDLRGIISSSTFDGSIISTDGYSGGIAAYNGGKSNYSPLGIYDCIFSGALKGGAGSVGGIISFAGNSNTTGSYVFNILNNMVTGDITTSNSRSGAICVGINPDKTGSVTLNILYNLVVTPEFTDTEALERVYGYYKSATGRIVNFKTDDGVNANAAYFPEGSTPVYWAERNNLITDITKLTGPDGINVINAQNKWTYFPENGNKNFRLPQLISNPYEGELPDYLINLFPTASEPVLSIEKSGEAYQLIIESDNGEGPLGYEIAVSDLYGNLINKVTVSSKNNPLNQIVENAGSYILKAKDLGGYRFEESDYSPGLVVSVSETVPGKLKNASGVYISKNDEELSNFPDVYGSFAIIGAYAPLVKCFELSRCGVLINNNYEISLDNVDYVSEAEKIQGDGGYAVLICGSGLQKNVINFAKPYAVYISSDGTETEVYGETQIFVLK